MSSSDLVLDMSEVLGKLKSALESDVRTSGMRIESMRRVNSDPNTAKGGWVGLYAQSIRYDPRSLGRGARNWKFTPTIRVLVQASNIADSSRAFEDLGDYLAKVLDVVFANFTLDGFVFMLSTIGVDYAIQENDAKSLHFVGALVTLTYEGSTL